jgi:hypothetical protein
MRGDSPWSTEANGVGAMMDGKGPLSRARVGTIFRRDIVFRGFIKDPV